MAETTIMSSIFPMSTTLLTRLLIIQKPLVKYSSSNGRKQEKKKHDNETQTLVIFMRQSEHTFIGRIVIKRAKPCDVKHMKLYVVSPRYSRSVGCKVPSLDSEGFECEKFHPLDHSIFNRWISSRQSHARWRFKLYDRPVPSVPFHYYLDTNVEADPIPGLCGDFFISLGKFSQGQSEPGGSRQFSLRLPKNSFIAIDDDLMNALAPWEADLVVYYLKSEKKLVYEDAWKSGQVQVHVPEAKRIVFGTVGNHQLLLDLKHDDRPAVNLGSEYLGLTSRRVDEYKFTEDFTDESSKPKQVVLGVPAKTPTFRWKKPWTIKLGKAKTYAGELLEGEGHETTGDYAENVLIVSDTLWVHLSSASTGQRYLVLHVTRPRASLTIGHLGSVVSVLFSLVSRD